MLIVSSQIRAALCMIKGSGTLLFSDVEFLYASHLYVRVLADYMPCTLIPYVRMMQLPVIKSQMDRVPAELLNSVLWQSGSSNIPM